MSNTIRFTPLDRAFDELLHGFLVDPPRTEGGAQNAARVRIDVSENDKSYVVRAEIPGVRKEDIDVAVDANQVQISAEVRNENEVKEGTRVLRSERHYGKVYRAFSLAQDIDESATEARYADGVLELTLAKKAPAAAKRITIQ